MVGHAQSYGYIARKVHQIGGPGACSPENFWNFRPSVVSGAFQVAKCYNLTLAQCQDHHQHLKSVNCLYPSCSLHWVQHSSQGRESFRSDTTNKPESRLKCCMHFQLYWKIAHAAFPCTKQLQRFSAGIGTCQNRREICISEWHENHLQNMRLTPEA